MALVLQQQQQQPSSIPVALLLTIVFLLMVAPLYSASEDPYLLIATQALKGVWLSAAVLVPLLILVAVSLQSNSNRIALRNTSNNTNSSSSSSIVPFSQVGGSSVGVALMLLFIIALIWYQPSL